MRSALVLGAQSNILESVIVFWKEVKAIDKSQLIMSEKDNHENMYVFVPYRLSHLLEVYQETRHFETRVFISKDSFIPLIGLVNQGQSS